ncbi:Transmembrane 9 superfamily member 4 [Schistosoma japonicum]|uniref:Transmembrane 9 superfamily member n=2 Tax=Schistosoma japonicum TaxID=6182 RepID=Q5DBZ7_SCHJA|nr:SJCHGC01731 protein [Schistosoma japonicum]KAH8867700.1 Transmembrane 9 superfamily member 4 [Schistosoma japonicum]CAX69575.1 Transmembrane 9 superfamily protein member 4 [Schistosoma japonicum]
MLSLIVLVYISSLRTSATVSVPGVTPNEFYKGESIEVRAVKLTSYVTQLPFEYYKLPFCRPKQLVDYPPENIGEILRGDRVVNTPFSIRMAENAGCSEVCSAITISTAEATRLKNFIINQYSVHLSIDNLPCGTKVSSDNGKTFRYEHGYRLGSVVDGVAYINNHLKFTLQYHQTDDGRYRFVGFEIEPMSISEKYLKLENGACKDLDSDISITNWKKIDGKETVIHFTSEVVWEPSDIKWASRWDIYLKSASGQLHWFSIINSVVIVLFLTSVIFMILIRTLRKDIAKYNRIDDVEDIIEESGWKLVHGDVFRPPRYTRLFTALFGSGVQLFFMVFIVIFFAMLGTLSPASRGALMNAAIFIYVFMGLFAGYFAGRLYKTLRGPFWKSTAVATGLLFPGIVLVFGLVINTFIWYKGSSAAIPFTTLLALLSLWLGISLPLIYIGFFFGYRKRGFEQPIRTNQIPRAVPDQRFCQNLLLSTLYSGALPFGAVFIEVFFIYNAIWESQFYYLFGFLFVVFIILIICCAQVAVVATYFQLCSEDYHWWWRTFITSGGAAVYLMGYSFFYFLTKLNITEFIPTIIYFGYSILMVISFWILTGTIGFTSAFIFLRYIYSVIKID